MCQCRGGNITQEQFNEVFDKLHPHIPGQNLDRAIPSKGDVIFEYQFDKGGRPGTVKDKSPNGYDANTNCKSKDSSLVISPGCSLTTPWSSKGRNYTLTLSLKVTELVSPTNTTLIAGSDSVLMLTPNITLFASGTYYRFNTAIPMKQWVELSIRGAGTKTFASVKLRGQSDPPEEEMFFTTGGKRVDMAIEAPIKEVTGWSGELRELRLTNHA